MGKLKKLLNTLLFPPAAIIILAVPLSVALLIYSLVLLDSTATISYISYFLSAYALTILCARTPKLIQFFRAVKDDNRYINRYLADAHLRVNISLYGTFILNTAYAIFQLGLGFYHHTVWYYSLAGYYIILAVMRFFLLKHTRTHKDKTDKMSELLIYRFCGILLLLMNIALSSIVFYIAVQGRSFIHHEITTISMATYTFATLITAVINVVKYRKYERPVLTASKIINLATALVSVLTLESAMLTAFGKAGQETFRRVMTGTTGAAVTLIILVIAVFMIIKSTKQIKRYKNAG